MPSKSNSIEYRFKTTPYLFLIPKRTLNKLHSVNSLAILFAVTELSLNYKTDRGKLESYIIRPKLVIKQHLFLKNLFEVKSLISLL
jgi:hypothetical protein